MGDDTTFYVQVYVNITRYAKIQPDIQHIPFLNKVSENLHAA